MRTASLAAGFLLTLDAATAQAAPTEVFTELGLHPTDPNQIVLGYAQGGQGLLFSNDGGQTFALRCGAAVSSSFTKSRAPLVVTADGEALLGTFAGLVRGGADGCGFGDDLDMTGLQVADFAPHPTDPSITFIATANSNGPRATGLVRRNADGSFTELGQNMAASSTGAELSLNRLQVVARAEGGLRFYASALASDGAGNYRPVIVRSDDEGGSWLSHDVTDAGEARVLLIGVDPTDPERIAVAFQRDGAADSVRVSSDGGQTFEERLQIFELGASSVAPDGRLWVGDAGGDAEYSQPGGLYLLDDFAAGARKLATYPVRCLGYRALDDRLFACKRSEFGSVDPATGEFSVRAGFARVGGFVTCGGEQLAPVCQPQLCDNWCGVLHYASAPLCDAYAELNPLCGPGARGYGEMGAPASNGPADLVLPGDEPPAPSVDAGSAEVPALAEAQPERPSHDGACRMGATSSRQPASLALVSLCPMLALALRRRQGASSRRHADDDTQICNPHRPRRH